MRRVSVRAILVLIFASCIFGVLTYASVKVSKNRNALEAAFIDLKHIFASPQGERHPTMTVTRRSSKGVNFQNASPGVGVVDAPALPGRETDAVALQPPSSRVTTYTAELPVRITQDDTYGIKGPAVPLHSSSDERPYVTRSSPLGFQGTASTPVAGSFIFGSSTAGPGSASGPNANPGKCCVPCVTPVPEPSWITLAGTAFAFSVLLGAIRVIRTWLLRRHRTHS